MKAIRKIEANNQNIVVIAKEGSHYYKWLENKSGQRKEDPFWNWEITEELYNQLMEDYNNKVIPNDFIACEYHIVKEPFENLSDSGVLVLINWFAYAYMTWDNQNDCWKYGRNRNHIEETNNK